MLLSAKTENRAAIRHCAAWSTVVLGLLLAGFAAAGEGGTAPFIQFSIQDASGNFFPQGEIEFCTPSGRCIYADIQPGFPGNFYLPSKELHADTLYTVMIYDPQVKVLWEMKDWVFEPLKYDPRWNRWLNVDKFRIYPRFFVHPDRKMTFAIDTTLNPEWERLMGQVNGYAGPDSLPDFPRFLLAAQGHLALGGRFDSDPQAAGGVLAVKPGFGLTGLLRFDYPQRRLKRDHWASFREIGFGYAQNRYETMEVITPGRRSDVIFHRAWLSAGIGRVNQEMTTHWSVAGALAWGGIYDGPEILKYLDRTYRLFGVGAQARAVQSFWNTDRADVGLILQTELMYYFADEGENDFWYGWAPSVSAGLVVY